MIVAMKFTRIALDRCLDKPLIIVDRGSWYRWALDRLGVEYKVERSFRYLRERTAIFHYILSTKNHI